MKEQAPTSKLGGKSTKDMQQKALHQKDVCQQTKTKRTTDSRKSTSLPQHSGQPKKRTKKARTAKTTQNKESPIKYQGMANTSNELGRGGFCQSGGDASSQKLLGGSSEAEAFLPNTIPGDSRIEKVVSDLVDTIADEIHYCASIFGPGPPDAVIDVGGNQPFSTLTSAAGTVVKTRHLSSFLPQEPEFKLNVTHDSPLKSSDSADRSIYPTDKNVCSLKKEEDNDSSGSLSATKCKPHDQGRPPNLEIRDAQTVVTAINRFVLEVYYPFLLSAKQNSRNESPSTERIRISTLLAIREVLIMNAEKLFTFSHLNQSLIDSIERDGTYLSHAFANAIVRNTAKRLNARHPESHFLNDFVQATRNYDVKSEDFQTSLARADVRSMYVHPGGGKTGQQKSVLAKVSFNYARKKHPLSCNSKHRNHAGKVGIVTSTTQPAPTACAVFQIEPPDAACDETEDVTKTLESLKSLLRRQHT